MGIFTFTAEQYLGFIRHVLTLAGGALITKGYASEDMINQLVGSLMTLIGFGWSLVKNSAPEAPATAGPATVSPPAPSKNASDTF